MVRRPTQQRPQNAELTTKQMQQAVVRLRKRISSIENLDPQSLVSRGDANIAKNSLNAEIDDALTRTFGQDSTEYRRYRDAAALSFPEFYDRTTPPHMIIEGLSHSKARSIALLETAINSLEEQIEESAAQAPANISKIQSEMAQTRQIFVVHGHDVGAREAVARFLEKCAFEAIVLHEKPNQGKTIIEKFEANAKVGFAVILLTPDDEAALPSGTPCRRARQNVILELGYFIGRLGRDRVCALKSGAVDLPSDILGVAWTDFDSGGAWKQALARELKAAGYEIDWNIVMAS